MEIIQDIILYICFFISGMFVGYRICFKKYSYTINKDHYFIIDKNYFDETKKKEHKESSIEELLNENRS